MANPKGYLLSKPLLEQIRRDNSTLRGIPRQTTNRYIGSDDGDRYLVKITGKYTGSAFGSVDSASYSAVQVISDSTGAVSVVSGGAVWGEDSNSESWPPIEDLCSLEARNGNISDSTLQRIPTNSYVEVFQRGNDSGDTMWYTDGREPHFDISFGLDYVTSGSTEYLRVHGGYVYGQSTSSFISAANYALSVNKWIYVQYAVNLNTGVISVTSTLQSTSSRPTEVSVTSTTRTVRTVIASIISGEVTTYWEGDIYATNFHKGFQGFQGFQGWQGPQGPEGPEGQSGTGGFQGFQGWQGPSGPSGPQGWQGPQGNQGNQGNQGPQGPQGPQGLQGLRGLQGNRGFQGLKAAIVETNEGYNALSCAESPEVLFFDIVTVKHTDFTSHTPIDPMFIEVCEDNLRVVSATCAKAIMIGVQVLGGEIVIETTPGISVDVTCVIAGTRKGFSNVRFPKCSEEQHTTNMKFWNNAGGM